MKLAHLDTSLSLTRYGIRTLVLAILTLVITTAMFGQSASPDLSIMRSRGVPAFQIVIFSADSDNSDLAASQSIVWKSFIDRLKKRKAAPLTAINEVTISPSADRLRAFELATQETEKFTIWLEFDSVSMASSNSRSTDRNKVRFLARFSVFYPGTTSVLLQGEIEQESGSDPTVETANNEKVIRDSAGRIVNSRPSVRLPGGGTTGGATFIEMDTLTRIGTAVADRIFNASAAKLK